MRFIPTVFHGIADYVVGVLVIALPFLLALEGNVRGITIALGAFVLLYSLMTDYELGVVRFLRIRFHLLLDALFGAGMLVLPFVLEIPAASRWPFYLIGVLALLLAATTRIRAEGTAAPGNHNVNPGSRREGDIR
ncbi:hypothetical protein DUT91_09575 [Phyllobacterium salinisoli]|uniref:SPW repeat-containing integral membrane domain-containing protein n=1 Tax=Phyllobacterium salinisoli TaxID=1899321 RepID=A0A368K7P9_9HYPH|nr:hypothetical protein [Phyllobacterium salinisoli]RCS24503.1 hypothetical protein DUT91_09575 [Phyllobacterium salinisoli]